MSPYVFCFIYNSFLSRVYIELSYLHRWIVVKPYFDSLHLTCSVYASSGLHFVMCAHYQFELHEVHYVNQLTYVLFFCFVVSCCLFLFSRLSFF